MQVPALMGAGTGPHVCKYRPHGGKQRRRKGEGQEQRQRRRPRQPQKHRQRHKQRRRQRQRQKATNINKSLAPEVGFTSPALEKQHNSHRPSLNRLLTHPGECYKMHTLAGMQTGYQGKRGKTKAKQEAKAEAKAATKRQRQNQKTPTGD